MNFLEFLKEKNYFPGENLFLAFSNAFSPVLSTTVIALEYNEGAVVGCDAQATNPNTLDKLQEPIKKIFRIDDCSVLGIAGVPSIAIEVAQLLKTSIAVEERINNRVISPEGKIKLLRRIVWQYFPLAMQTQGSFATEYIFISYDKKIKKTRIFSCDATAFYSEHKVIRYHSVGSGRSHAMGQLSRLWREGLNIRETLAISQETLESVNRANAGTGPPYFFAIVDKEGIREFSGEEVYRLGGDNG